MYTRALNTNNLSVLRFFQKRFDSFQIPESQVAACLGPMMWSERSRRLTKPTSDRSERVVCACMLLRSLLPKAAGPQDAAQNQSKPSYLTNHLPVDSLENVCLAFHISRRGREIREVLKISATLHYRTIRPSSWEQHRIEVSFI